MHAEDEAHLEVANNPTASCKQSPSATELMPGTYRPRLESEIKPGLETHLKSFVIIEM
jgi:hypothetical protein